MLSVTPTPGERGDASRTLAQWWGNVADVDPAMSQCSAVFNQLTISVITHPVNLVWTAAAGSMWQTHNICGCRSASLADQMYIERGDISLVGWISRDVGRRGGGGGVYPEIREYVIFQFTMKTYRLCVIMFILYINYYISPDYTPYRSVYHKQYGSTMLQI